MAKYLGKRILKTVIVVLIMAVIIVALVQFGAKTVANGGKVLAADLKGGYTLYVEEEHMCSQLHRNMVVDENAAGNARNTIVDLCKKIKGYRELNAAEDVMLGGTTDNWIVPPQVYIDAGEIGYKIEMLNWNNYVDVAWSGLPIRQERDGLPTLLVHRVDLRSNTEGNALSYLQNYTGPDSLNSEAGLGWYATLEETDYQQLLDLLRKLFTEESPLSWLVMDSCELYAVSGNTVPDEMHTGSDLIERMGNSLSVDAWALAPIREEWQTEIRSLLCTLALCRDDSILSAEREDYEEYDNEALGLLWLTADGEHARQLLLASRTPHDGGASFIVITNLTDGQSWYGEDPGGVGTRLAEFIQQSRNDTSYPGYAAQVTRLPDGSAKYLRNDDSAALSFMLEWHMANTESVSFSEPMEYMWQVELYGESYLIQPGHGFTVVRDGKTQSYAFELWSHLATGLLHEAQ